MPNAAIVVPTVMPVPATVIPTKIAPDVTPVTVSVVVEFVFAVPENEPTNVARVLIAGAVPVPGDQ